MAIARIRSQSSVPLFSYGFRPFFLFGGAYALFGILIWLPIFFGEIELPSHFVPVDWHVHEMVFGYVGAVITGFLLTAIPNWTGRLPLSGWPLALLVLLWFAGRAAVLFSGKLGPGWTAAIDCAFLFAVCAATATEIIAGRNWRNLVVLVPVTVLATANMYFHYEAAVSGQADIARRIGLGTIVLLITIIGGRIVPSFTRNWLARENPGRLPASLGRFDAVTILLTAAALLSWSFLPDSTISGVALLTAGAANAVRLARWAGDRAVRDKLVFVLHVAYAFVPLGLLATGAAVLRGAPAAAGIHLLAIGAAGAMTLAVMTRATLGHTGRPLSASLGTKIIYGAIVAAALARTAAEFLPGATVWLHVAAAAWVLAFIGFLAVYGPMLLRPRQKA